MVLTRQRAVVWMTSRPSSRRCFKLVVKSCHARMADYTSHQNRPHYSRCADLHWILRRVINKLAKSSIEKKGSRANPINKIALPGALNKKQKEKIGRAHG